MVRIKSFIKKIDVLHIIRGLYHLLKKIAELFKRFVSIVKIGIDNIRHLIQKIKLRMHYCKINHRHRNITVIVPIYDDWNSLEKCIVSLKKYLNKHYQVFLVNDVGPNADAIEKQIKETITGCHNFRYFRNSKNMGFVESCNNAVNNLDKSNNDILLLNSDTEITYGAIEEMVEVLHLNEKHGVVCPRSNNATVLCFPLDQTFAPTKPAEESYTIHNKVKSYLLKYSYVPTPVGFCMLIRRHLIKQFGLFDLIFSPGYHDETDFYQRVNQYGYSAVAANRAFVFHSGGRSFGTKSLELNIAHEKIFFKRYPYYLVSLEDYRKNINAIDWFANEIYNLSFRPRIAIDLLEMPNYIDDDLCFIKEFVEKFVALFSLKYDIDILINKEANDIFRISDTCNNVFYLDDQINKKYSFLFSPFLITKTKHLKLVNEIALKYAFFVNNLVSIRTSYLLTQSDPGCLFVLKAAIKYADGIIFPSDSVIDDFLTFFDNDMDLHNLPIKKIRPGINPDYFFDSEDVNLPFNSYALVVGGSNKYCLPQKIIELLSAFKKLNFIAVDNNHEGKISSNVFSFNREKITRLQSNKIWKQAKFIIYPNIYDGLDLPLLKATMCLNKTIIVHKISLNDELFSWFEHSNIIEYLTNDELFNVLSNYENIIGKNNKSLKSRSFDQYIVDTEKYFSQIIHTSLETNKLIDRVACIRNVDR